MVTYEKQLKIGNEVTIWKKICHIRLSYSLVQKWYQYEIRSSDKTSYAHASKVLYITMANTQQAFKKHIGII
jgi:hypothetical protein